VQPYSPINILNVACLATSRAVSIVGLSGPSPRFAGPMLIVAPIIGAVVLTWWIGAYALVFGVSLVMLAFGLRNRLTKHRQSPAAQPAG
jgi:uncharacterized membrane protein HdeD (DUF308 family)